VQAPPGERRCSSKSVSLPLLSAQVSHTEVEPVAVAWRPLGAAGAAGVTLMVREDARPRLRPAPSVVAVTVTLTGPEPEKVVCTSVPVLPGLTLVSPVQVPGASTKLTRSPYG